MKTETMKVTPALAREWLKANTDNRPLRPGWVDSLRGAWDRGEWKLTNASIGFASSGRLIDGQHRLTMVSQLPEGTVVPMNVTRGMDEDAFDAIDQGFRRTVSDLYGISGALAAAAKFIGKIANGNNAADLTPQVIRPYIDWIEPEFSRLFTFCSTSAVIFSSAPVKAAAIMQMKRGHDEDFILSAYRAMVLSHVDEMSHAARVLVQQRMNGKIVSARSSDLFCRALRVFDSHQRQRIATIVVKDQAQTIQEARDFIIQAMTKKSPVKAGQWVAKPFLNSTRKRAAG